MKDEVMKPGKALTLAEINAEIVGWVSAMLTSKNYGVFGIEITLHEGIPLSIQKTERFNYRRGAGNGTVMLT